MKANRPSTNPAHLRLVGRAAGVSSAGARPAEVTEEGQATAARPATGPEPPLTSSRRSRRSLPSDPGAKPREDSGVTAKSTRGRAVANLLELSDAQLVPIARSGDQLAFEALYRKHASFAIHLATRIEGSARDVEDVVHDAFIKAFARIGDLAEPGAFRSWLGSIVVFAVRSRLRRARLMSMLGLGRGADPVDLDSITSSDASPHTRAQLAQIYALLRTLPTDERIGWTLRYVEGHELDVVAKLTNCSLATVKRRISRAQKFLEHHFVDTQDVETQDRDAAAPGVEPATTDSAAQERAPAPGSVTISRRSAR
ncbi:MAG: sigma-70 family RNA polymerase sigma factor [Polyangiaceae bacterium]|nr:sigma-70 family RNA polymerase sigma factor [Polyangiaceae bacterium]